MSFLNLIRTPTATALEETVLFAQKRHGVLAGNIANLDTPGYQARDLSPAVFETRLREALEAERAPRGSSTAAMGELAEGDALSRAFWASVQATAAGGSDPSTRPDRSDAPRAEALTRFLATGELSRSSDPADPLRQVHDLAPSILRHDGNDLSIEQQVASLAKNESLHNLAITLLRGQFSLLKAAITENVEA